MNLLALSSGRLVPPGRLLALVSDRVGVYPLFILLLDRLDQLNISMTPSGSELATLLVCSISVSLTYASACLTESVDKHPPDLRVLQLRRHVISNDATFTLALNRIGTKSWYGNSTSFRNLKSNRIWKYLETVLKGAFQYIAAGLKAEGRKLNIE